MYHREWKEMKETEIGEARRRRGREGNGGNRSRKRRHMGKMWVEKLKGTQGETHKDVMGRETLRD